MAEEQQSGEKTHEPTEGRLEEARKRGDVPLSRDLGAAAAYLGLLLALIFGGVMATQQTGAVLATAFSRADTLAPRLLDIGGAALSAGLVGEAALGLAAIFVIPFVLVILSIVGQQALVFAPEKLAPKASRINPIEQAKQKYGPTGLAEFLKSATKLILISIVAGFYVMGEIDQIIGLARTPPMVAPSIIGDLTIGLLIWIVVIAFAIAAVDVLWQRFDHRRKLRMTHQELKDEVKRSEGDPETKRQRQMRGREIATNRMLLDVPNAAVVIVNPTHYAVALRWRRDTDPAPVVVAKGVDGVALRIRETADAAGVPIHSDPPTARALEATTEIGAEIDPDHYQAVAAAIRFADKMRAKVRERGAS